MRLLSASHYRRNVAIPAVLAAMLSCMAACSAARTQNIDPVTIPHRVELASISVKALNYTPWYIHEFEIEGPDGSGIQGGGGNMMPAHVDGRPSGGGSDTCCMTYPADWQPDLRLTVRWLVNKKMDGKTPSYWYKAENVRIAQYGETNYSTWAIFLPGDRVRLMITDGNHDGGNNPNNRPPDDDPLVVHGVLDKEWNELYPNGVARGVQ